MYSRTSGIFLLRCLRRNIYSVILVYLLPVASFLFWIRQKKLCPRFYCPYPLHRVFGSDVLFLQIGEGGNPYIGDVCLVPTFIMGMMDSFLKYLIWSNVVV